MATPTAVDRPMKKKIRTKKRNPAGEGATAPTRSIVNPTKVVKPGLLNALTIADPSPNALVKTGTVQENSPVVKEKNDEKLPNVSKRTGKFQFNPVPTRARG
ncbi:hypothetical protein E4U15_006434 [Claviceps sp. LM218 group G6]|nr:hypothetical protein E4U15_006434 [Claviceps sp. LM218 group G6]